MPCISEELCKFLCCADYSNGLLFLRVILLGQRSECLVSSAAMPCASSLAFRAYVSINKFMSFYQPWASGHVMTDSH